jgi:hypothetical protein
MKARACISANGAIYESQGHVYAPRARNMKARGKREARRPWLPRACRARPEGPKYFLRITPFSGLDRFGCLYQGRRAPLRFALAPGFHIPRLWRCDVFRAFDAATCSAPLTLRRVPRLWRCDIFRALGAATYSAPFALRTAWITGKPIYQLS